MIYANLMRHASMILFVVALVVLFGTFMLTIFVVGHSRESAPAMLGVIGALKAAVLPFFGAAVLWRLDKMLNEPDDRP